MELNFAAICAAVESAVPDHEALVWRDRGWTWREVGDRTRRLARALHDAGLGVHGSLEGCAGWESPHDHVALYLYNGNQYLEGMLASYQARCAPLNVNYRYRAAELHHVLDDSAAKVVIFDGRFGPTLAEVVDDLPSIELLVQVDDGEERSLLAGAVRYEELLAGSSPELPGPLVDGWSGDDLYVCYTGGTTGRPKGVLWRQHDFLASALGLDRVAGAPIDDMAQFGEAARSSRLRALPAPPLMHGAAHWNAMSCWAAGGTVVIQDDTTRLDPADLWRSVDRHRATSLLIVGDPFARPLVDELDRAAAAGSPYDVGSLRHVLSGGAVLSPAVRDALMQRLPDVTVVDVLGSTESGRQGISRRAPRRGDEVDATPAFRPEAASVVLSEDRSTEVRAGSDEIGWLAKRGQVPLGYLGDRARTEETFPVVDGVRLVVAGDRARVTAEGSIELLGRDSVTINTGGEKVFAEEVETVLKEHPVVFDAIVCGVASERWGQEVVAVVQLREGPTIATVPDDDLREWCRARLADFKAPKRVVRVTEVVRSPSGKPDYAWARQAATPDRAG